MEWKNKGIFFSVLVLLFVMLVGCATKKIKFDNPYLGYMHARAKVGDKKYEQEGIDALLKGYQEQIAKEEFDRRNKPFAKIFDDKSLDRMEKYVALLEEPVSIDEKQWKGDLERSLNKRERKTIIAYWESNCPISFDGSEVLYDWSYLLANAKQQLFTDKTKAAELEQAIDGLRIDHRYRDALVKTKELQPYRSGKAAELTEKLKKEAADYWVGKRLSEIHVLREAKPYDAAHEQQVLNLFAKINADVDAFGHREVFNGVYNEWMDLLGDNWRSRIVKMGDSKLYWDAYQFAWTRYRDNVATVKFAEAYRKGLKLAINKGYLEILDNGVRYYATLASSAHTKGQSGKAYVYCCMAKEMYDFNAVAGIDYAGDDAETWYKRISELEKNELLPALGSRVSRRLVIHDFELDAEGLSKKLRKACQKKYVPGNNHAWGLEVVVDKVTLAQLEADTRLVRPEDYAIKWSNAEIDVRVKQEPSVQRTAFVRTDQINLVDNPFRRDKTSEFYKLKQVKAQKVALYSLIDTQLGLDLSCDMKAAWQYRGQSKPLGLRGTESKVQEYNKAYGSGINTTSNLLLPNVSEEMKYYLPDIPNNKIPRDDIPENKRFILPEEDRIKAGLVNDVIEDLVEELERLVDIYPVELLTGADSNDPDKYLDSVGTVLFYIAKLSETDAAKREAAGKGYEWLPVRDQIAKNMNEWCGMGERWAAARPDQKTIMKSLWDECVRVGNEQGGR
jgi:hypothetical protein